MIWKKIEGTNCSVSDEGIVRNDETLSIINPTTNTTGYMKVQLCKRSDHLQKYVHVLVAEAFVPKPENLEGKVCVYHKDHDKTNNKASNLGWENFTTLMKTYHKKGLYKNHQESMKKKICMIDKMNNFRSVEFDSVIQAAIYLKSIMGDEIKGNLPSIVTNIQQAIAKSDTRTAYGYTWKRIIVDKI